MSAPIVGKSGKTVAHSGKQLAGVLGLSPARFDVAVRAGAVPATDLKTGRWSGNLVDTVVARAEEIAASVPLVFDVDEVKDRMGLPEVHDNYGRFRRGRAAGLIPAPDVYNTYWSAAVVEDLAARAETIAAAIPAQPLGAKRCGWLLREWTGLDAVSGDVAALAAAGHTAVVEEFEGTPLFDVDALKAAVAEGGAGLDLLTGRVTARAEALEAWKASSLTTEEAAAILGWKIGLFLHTAGQQGISIGRLRRWARTDIMAMACDEELAEQVRQSTELGANEAADRLDVRRVDFDSCVRARWIQPSRAIALPITSKLNITVPLYRLVDVEALLELPGIDWDVVRSVPPGRPSALREYIGADR